MATQCTITRMRVYDNILFNDKKRKLLTKNCAILTIYTMLKIFKSPWVFPTRDTIREQPTADEYPWIACVPSKLRCLSLRLGLIIWALGIWLSPRISLLRRLRGVFRSLHRLSCRLCYTCALSHSPLWHSSAAYQTAPAKLFAPPSYYYYFYDILSLRIFINPSCGTVKPQH